MTGAKRQGLRVKETNTESRVSRQHSKMDLTKQQRSGFKALIMGTKYRLLIYVIVVFVCAGLLVCFFRSEPAGEVPAKSQLPIQQRPAGAIAAEEKLAAGEVGEITVRDKQTDQVKPLATPEMPIRITSASGRIVSIGENSLLVMGQGNNFADGLARELTCVFTDKTITVSRDKILYKGLSGLGALQEGLEVLVGADENIRGKTEFEVKTIKVLK